MAKKSKKKQKKGSAGRRRYSFETKLRAVKLYLEEGYPADLVAEELGLGRSTLTTWAKRYREEGEDGLRTQAPGKGRAQVSKAAKAKAVELKRKNPEHGNRRISQVLKRVFFLKAGPETVRKTLKEEDLVQPPNRNVRLEG